MEQPNINHPVPPQRSGLLTTLCILTWVMGGISIILKLFALISPSYVPVYQILIDLLVNIGSILAAVMMWKLNRVGLLIYAICELIPAITNIAFGGASMAAIMPLINLSGMDPMVLFYSSIVLTVVIDLVFVFLYHLGLKQSVPTNQNF
jgi:hypothetical protein